MTTPLPHQPRFKISDAVVQSCRAYSTQDFDTAFLWAVEVLRRAGDTHYLNPSEASYIKVVLKKKKKR